MVLHGQQVKLKTLSRELPHLGKLPLIGYSKKAVILHTSVKFIVTRVTLLRKAFKSFSFFFVHWQPRIVTLWSEKKRKVKERKGEGQGIRK